MPRKFLMLFRKISPAEVKAETRANVKAKVKAKAKACAAVCESPVNDPRGRTWSGPFLSSHKLRVPRSEKGGKYEKIRI